MKTREGNDIVNSDSNLHGRSKDPRTQDSVMGMQNLIRSVEESGETVEAFSHVTMSAILKQLEVQENSLKSN